MSTLLDPNRRALDLTGAVMSGAKLYTYATGSSTPLATYQDEARTVVNTNPVVADANGFFPRMYGTPTSLYRLVLKTSADVTIRTEDNVASLESSATSAITRLKQLVACPLDYGATGDGVVNDAVALQAAITAALGVVDLAGKTYKCNATLSVAKSNLEIRNGTIDFSGVVGSSGFQLQGSSSGVAKTLTGNTLAGSRVVTTSNVSGISSGQIAVLSSNRQIADTANYLGEIFSVISASGTQTTLSDEIYAEAGFLTADAAQIQTYNQISNVSFRRLKLLAGSSGPTHIISADYCEGILIDSCEIYPLQGGDSAAGVRFKYCIGCDVVDSLFVSVGNKSCRGVSISNSSRKCGVERATFRGMGWNSVLTWGGAVRIGCDLEPGQPQDNRVIGCEMDHCQIGIGIHGFANRTIIDGCKISGTDEAGGAQYCILNNGVNTSIDDCWLFAPNAIGTGGGYAVYCDENPLPATDFSNNIEIVNTKAYTTQPFSVYVASATNDGSRRSVCVRSLCGVGGMWAVAGTGLPGLYVHDARLVSVLSSRMNLVDLTDCLVVDFSSCDLIGSDAAADIVSIVAPTAASQARFRGCSFSGTMGRGIDCYGDDNVLCMIDSCSFSGTVSFSYVRCDGGCVISGSDFYYSGASVSLVGAGTGSFSDFRRFVVSGCTFIGSGGAPISIDGCDGAVVSGNYILSNGSAHAIVFLNRCDRCVIHGNTISETINGAYSCISGADVRDSVFSGNVLWKSYDVAPNINITAGARCVFSGNHLTNGTYGIEYGAATAGLADGNSFVGMATGNTNGAGLTVGDFV